MKIQLRFTKLTSILFLMVSIAPCLPRASAQVSTAAITGAITDSTGAIIPRAHVVVNNVLTGVVTSATSNNSGEYNIEFLLPGTYNVVVEVNGFKKYSQSGLTLAVGDHPTVDVHLQIGASDQTVTVNSVEPLLQTSDDSLGSLITNKQMDGLPLNGRTPMVMAQFAAGVVSTTNPGLVRAFDNSGVSAFSVAGLPNKNAEILMDGSPDNASDNAIAYSPPVDAVEQLKINVFESDAGYGHSGGGVANQITKSGTNGFHGSLYEFNENSALNANSYFNDRNNVKKGVSRQNQYGGSVNGPVWIPRLFDGRDKLFFLYAYEGYKDSGPNYTTVSVPTVAERTGDFSALLPLGCPTGYATPGNAVTCNPNPTAGASFTKPYPNPNQLYNPNTAALVGTTVTRTPIPGNILSNAGLTVDPIAANILKLYPQPTANYPGTHADGTNNYYSPYDNGDTYFNNFGRLDYAINQKNHLNVTYRYNKRIQYVNQLFGPSDPAIGDSLTRINNGGSIVDVYTLSPSFLGETRLNYTRYVQNQVPLAQGYGANTLGFPSYIQSTATDLIFPRFNLTNYQSLGVPTTSYSLAPFENYDIYSALIKTVKKHTIKGGVDLRRYQKGQLTAGNAQGAFTFGNNYVTPTNASTGIVVGQDLASLELGLPTAGSYDINSKTFGTTDYMAFFVQDDWRVRPDLVLNIGLRFDHDFPAYERYGRAINGFSNAVSPIAAAAQAAYAAHPITQLAASAFAVNGGLTFASASSPNTYNSLSKTFSPRLGFSYTPAALGGKTSIRGGFGIFVLPLFPFNNGFNTSGFSQTTSLVASTNGYLTPAATLSNPFPSTNPILQPTGSALGLSTFLGQSITYFEPNAKNGYSERWNLSVQHQFPGKTLVEVDYLANHAVKLPINYYPNFIPKQYLFSTTASAVTPSASNPAVAFASTSGAANPFKGLEPGGSLNTSSTTSQAQLLGVYPQFNEGYTASSNTFSGITEQYAPFGSSYFEALDIRVEKRSSFGLTFIGNFQWSKLLERVSYLNNSDPSPELRISQYDHPIHTVMAMTYELPYGRKRMYGGNAPRYLDLPLGGWVVNGIFTYQQGAPLTLGNVVRDFTVPLNYNPRQTNLGTPAFNTAAFDTNSVQPQYNIRTLPSQFANFRVDAYNDFDASVLKDFNFTEGTYLQIRFEAFNAINRPQFGGPNLSPTAGSSFGIISGTANNSRILQVGAKIMF